jgi:hypothetical protein
MAETLIEKITSEVSSYYAVATQHRPDNDIACRTRIRRAIQSKLQPYVDSKLIASYTVICDETNNVTLDIKQPVKLDVFVKITKHSPQQIISLPLKKPDQPHQTAAPKSNSLLGAVIDKADLLWDKLTGKQK